MKQSIVLNREYMAHIAHEAHIDFNFCGACGAWLSPSEGQIVVIEGEPKAFCYECAALREGRACAVVPGSLSGLMFGIDVLPGPSGNRKADEKTSLGQVNDKTCVLELETHKTY